MDVMRHHSRRGAATKGIPIKIYSEQEAPMKHCGIIIALLILSLASCGGDGGGGFLPVGGTPAPNEDATAVMADMAALEIQYSGGDDESAVTQDLTLPGAGAGGTAITWSSGAASVIGNDGTVTRPASGSGDVEVTLTATITKGSESDTKEFRVTVKALPCVQSVTLDRDSSILLVHGTLPLEATVYPAGANDGVTWESSDPGVAVVSDEGVITALGMGSTTITVTTDEGSRADTCGIEVRDLFFSEYVDGHLLSNALEIYNPGDWEADLSGYKVFAYLNANNDPGNPNFVCDLPGTMASRDVFVIAHPEAIKALTDLADVTHMVAHFSGNDVLVLKHDGVIIDSIGKMGTVYPNIDSITYLRRPGVLTGDTNPNDVFNMANEWIDCGQDDFTHLGFHITD
jgi:hypothetical protein